jgi:hypothetical protein
MSAIEQPAALVGLKFESGLVDALLHDIDPVALPLPFWPHGIHWYGIMYLLGFAAAFLLGRHRIRAGRFAGIDENRFSDLLFNGMLGVVIGGRVGYVLFYGWSDFVADPLFLLRINLTWVLSFRFHCWAGARALGALERGGLALQAQSNCAHGAKSTLAKT